MPLNPPALLIKFPGTNCDAETARALEAAGFTTSIVPVSLITPEHLQAAKLVVFSGGFSYGDYVMAGRIAQLVSEVKLGDSLQKFIAGGGYVLGICNGFQIMTKLGVLPEGSLIDNTSGRFQCRWVKLKNVAPESPYLADLPDDFELPIAHAEGRFVAADGKAQQYFDDGLVALTYKDDVNGSTLQIAALQDKTGRVFGLMPHPERFMHPQDHYDPDWSARKNHGWGYYLFRSVWREISGNRKLIA